MKRIHRSSKRNHESETVSRTATLGLHNPFEPYSNKLPRTVEVSLLDTAAANLALVSQLFFSLARLPPHCVCLHLVVNNNFRGHVRWAAREPSLPGCPGS
jgi:hypothetical protein